MLSIRDEKLSEEYWGVDEEDEKENGRNFQWEFSHNKRKTNMNQVSNIESSLQELNQTNKLCEALLQTPHYKKMGSEGIMAIVQKAKSLGINPLEALNGGMYFVQGKVEMQAILMAKMIRSKGHSITMGKESNNETCILHGKRKDNGDTWKASFSLAEAKAAGIYKENGPWGRYTADMLYNRALSRLARQLFADVIGNCYIEGEIRDLAPENEVIPRPRTSADASEVTIDIQEEWDPGLTEEQKQIVNESLELYPELKEVLRKHVGVTDPASMTPDHFVRMQRWLAKKEKTQLEAINE